MNPPECTTKAVISFFGLLDHNSMQTYWFAHELYNHTLNEKKSYLDFAISQCLALWMVVTNFLDWCIECF